MGMGHWAAVAYAVPLGNYLLKLFSSPGTEKYL